MYLIAKFKSARFIISTTKCSLLISFLFVVACMFSSSLFILYGEGRLQLSCGFCTFGTSLVKDIIQKMTF